MQESDLIKVIDKLQKGEIPFALWSLPGSSAWEGIAQNNSHLENYNKDSREGFIVSPFKNNGIAKFIRADKKIENTFSEEYDLHENPKSIDDSPWISSRSDYLKQCESIINSIKEGKAEKVVLSRVLKQKITQHPAILFLKLSAIYPEAMVFLYFIGEYLWLGASPETLLTVDNGKFTTMALAGSLAVDSNKEWTVKENMEQAYVEEYVEDILLNKKIDFIKEGPFTSIAGPVKHLLSTFQGNISETLFNELVFELHPTPAVCGIPVNKAKSIIENTELHQRRDYTGFIGPVKEMNKHIFVNLRSSMIIDDMMYLYLGGGITKDSIAEEEWKETELKAKTLLSIL